MSALQGNTFDREYTAEVSAGGLMPLSTIFLLFHEFQFYISGQNKLESNCTLKNYL
jgi:hypothetical protein